MTTLQKTLITAAFAAVVGVGIYEAHQNSGLREQNQTLQQQQAPLAEQNRQLQQERDDATNRLAMLAGAISSLNSSTAELLKLRAEVTRLRQGSQSTTHPAENDPTGSAAKAWLDKVNILKQRLAQTPDAHIPELQYLSDQDWLDVVKGNKLETDQDYRQAFSLLRYAAENAVARVMQAGP